MDWTNVVNGDDATPEQINTIAGAVIQSETDIASNNLKAVQTLTDTEKTNARENIGVYYAVDTSTTANAIAITVPNYTAYIDGSRFLIKVKNTNTSTAVTINVNSLGAKTVVIAKTVAPYVGDLNADVTYEFVYNSTLDKFRIQAGQFDAHKLGGQTADYYASVSSLTAGSWITPTFVNSWVQYDTAHPVGYYKDACGIVHLRGRVSGGTAATVAFTLPSGYRPSALVSSITFPVIQNSDLLLRALLGSGNITPTLAAYNTYVSLDSISFRAEA